MAKLVDRKKHSNYQQVTAHVYKDVVLRLKMYCAQHRTTITEVVEKALIRFLDELDELDEDTSESGATESFRTLAEIVQRHFYKLLTDPITPIPIDNLKAVANGEKPLIPDLVAIASILNIPEERLTAMRDKEFPCYKEKQANGHK